ncbi:hypothetical protein QQX98_010836 [Neonectria punicea]|uniref:Uncharacterized protein n=1 Tax=Neonectria punicea TaxID=979145 RepID=A0ABR1GNC4_9HYPO
MTSGPEPSGPPPLTSGPTGSPTWCPSAPRPVRVQFSTHHEEHDGTTTWLISFTEQPRKLFFLFGSSFLSREITKSSPPTSVHTNCWDYHERRTCFRNARCRACTRPPRDGACEQRHSAPTAGDRTRLMMQSAQLGPDAQEGHPQANPLGTPEGPGRRPETLGPNEPDRPTVFTPPGPARPRALLPDGPGGSGYSTAGCHSDHDPPGAALGHPIPPGLA